MKFCFSIFSILMWAGTAFATCGFTDVCKDLDSPSSTGSTSNPAYPTTSSKININPSAVPIKQGTGIEGIIYNGSVDLVLAEGLGRAGAAVSPSNTEQTFFGAPAFELPQNYLARQNAQTKYSSQKITLATAASLYSGGSDMGHKEAQIGIMGRYNKVTNAVSPGIGVSGIWGPFTWGYSIALDQTELDYTIYNGGPYYNSPNKPVIKYALETYSAGAFLGSLTLDYSVMRVITDDISTVSVLTGSLLVKHGIFTLSNRNEASGRAAYDYVTQSLAIRYNKSDYFAGAQWAVSGKILLGIFYNYYLLHEGSIGATFYL